MRSSMLIAVLVGIFVLLAPYASAQDCTTLTGQQCALNNITTCTIDYQTSPVSCLNGIPTDGCALNTNSSTCAAAGCFWDRYISGCFVALQLENLIFPSMFWSYTFGTSPYDEFACQYHGYAITPQGTCLPYGSNGTNIVAPVSIQVSDLANFSIPMILQDTLIFQGFISIPFVLDLAHPSALIFSLSTANPGLATQFSTANLCNSLGSNLTVPNGPIYYANGTAALTAYATEFINENHNFNFDQSTEGIVLRALFGNVSIGANSSFLTSVSVSADGSDLIFEYSQDLNTIYNNCHGPSQLTYRTLLTFSQYVIPISVITRTQDNVYASTVASFSVLFQLDGAVTVSEASEYSPSIVLNEVVPIQGVCASGSEQLQMIYTISYSNVQSQTVTVGPRSINDILQQTSTSGLVQCYGDNATIVEPTVCTVTNPPGEGLGQTCSTTFTMLSRCRDITVDGDAFDFCNGGYTSPQDIATDLGNSSALYPAGLDGVHSFFIASYVCSVPSNGSNITQCFPANPNPGAPDFISSNINLNIYPTTFVTAPVISIDFGVLMDPSSNLSQNANTSMTTLFNATDQSGLGFTPLYSISNQVNNLQRFTMAIQISDPNIRNVFTLTILLAQNNISFVPLLFNGSVDTNGRVLHYADVRAYMVVEPKAFDIQFCPTCAQLPTCEGVIGCDGFSIQQAALTTLSPAQAYLVTVNYQITLPQPTSRRRLLANGAYVEGASAFNSAVFVINVTQEGNSTITTITETQSSSSSFGLSTFAIAGICIGVGVLLLIVVAILIWTCCFSSAACCCKSNSSSNTSASASSSKYSQAKQNAPPARTSQISMATTTPKKVVGPSSVANNSLQRTPNAATRTIHRSPMSTRV